MSKYCDIRNECQTKLATIRADVPFLNVKSLLNRVERRDLLEEVEPAVSKLGVWEVGDLGASGPGDDADEQNTNNDCALHAEHHQEDGEETAAENTNPHGWVAHLVVRRAHAGLGVLVIVVAAGKFHRSRGGASDGTDTSRVGETNECEVKTDTNTGCKFDRRRNCSGKPLTHATNGERDKNETFNEDGRQSNLVRDKTRAVESNNSVSEVSVETHARCAGNGHVGEETHSKSRQSRDSGSGSDEITLDFLNTLHVLDVCRTEIGHAFSRADAGATSFRDNRAVDRDDVSHSEESSQASANLREEV